MGLILFGILQLFNILINRRFRDIITPVYLILFGIMSLPGSGHIKLIKNNCSFLGNFFGKGLFNVYIGYTVYIVYGQSSLEIFGILPLICCKLGFIIMSYGIILIALWLGVIYGNKRILELQKYVEEYYKIEQNNMTVNHATQKFTRDEIDPKWFKICSEHFIVRHVRNSKPADYFLGNMILDMDNRKEKFCVTWTVIQATEDNYRKINEFYKNF